MKHLLTAIACCLEVAGSAQIEYLPDSISHKPGYILFEPCGGPTIAQFFDSVVVVMYGSLDSVPDIQDPPQPGFYGFANMGFGGCSEGYNTWTDVGQYWDHVMNGNLWGTHVQELVIPQFGSGKYLFDLCDISENFNVWEWTCFKAYYLFPRNSVGGGENWRLTHQQVNQCNILSVSTWASPPCPNEETPQQFYFESSTNSDLDGWYIVQEAGSWVNYLDHPNFVPTKIEAISQSCVGCSGCTDEEACNYYSYDITDNTNCDYEGCHRGCMDEGACNYDAMALFDNGQCIYPDPGYTCDGTLATAFCGEGTVWNDALQQCIGADPTTVEEACVGDLDGDGLRAVSDLLLFLSVFGEPCSD